MYYVYILLCLDKSYYVGLTDNIRKRLSEYNQKMCKYTKSRLPVKLVWVGIFGNKKIAARFEKYLKSGSGNAFMKKRLIQ
ncbi:MAG: GIY-YIG nuclease family protein [Candidatus Portnoybacteria bacterium]|nr:GIY-YIG nuclease family protein [Candidatus Portnoybacteria bacterium]